jgi:two-component system OmpR family response regulator
VSAIQESENMPRVLCVDDDPGIGELIANYFGQYAFDVMCVSSGREMRAAIASGGVDLVLLDLGLEDEDGLDLTRYLRQHWSGPVIIVSGRGETIDRVVGLELGADDYVTKPFDLRELLARVKSVLRRAAAGEHPADRATSGDRREIIAFEGWSLDPGARRLLNPAGLDVALTRGEFELLLALLERPQRVLSRDQLMQRVHHREAGPFDRTIDVQIGRLRKKIERDPQQPQLIKAVRGLGYQFAAEARRLPAGSAVHD